MKMLLKRVEHVNIHVYTFVYVYICIYIFIYIYKGGLMEYISKKVAAYGQFVLVYVNTRNRNVFSLGLKVFEK
mgnify:CR=1 FL=1